MLGLLGQDRDCSARILALQYEAVTLTKSCWEQTHSFVLKMGGAAESCSVQWRSSELVLNGVEQHGRAAFTEWQVRLPWRQYRCVCDVVLEKATGNDEVQLGQQTVNVVSQCVVLQGDDALLVEMLTHE